ncbi:MAG: GNAT family N-acetyltransferase [Micavibrio sp.]|nr:GNAT family N-acetyltransferase [Micavibrio sp.]HCK33092.1 GNAT family N-acetyltransferase [Rhodospirillaceae bacterium]|tara:strand:- start:523 stop:1074 length:552 start_codon:yes stop_codon:yes gene_type:complete
MTITENSTFTFRQAGHEDAQGIAAVHVRSWQIAYKGLINQDYLDSLDIEARAVSWQESLSNPNNPCITLIALENNKVVGFLTIGPSRNDVFTDDVELYAIYIDPDYFGKGLGSGLFKKCHARILKHGTSGMFVNVLTDNLRGRDFYERMGAKSVANSEFSTKIHRKSYQEIIYYWPSLSDIKL